MTAYQPRNASGYSGTPLPRKLGIKAGHRVGLFHPPHHFADVLGPVDGATLIHASLPARDPFDIAIYFAANRRRLAGDLTALPRAVRIDGALWIAWPKRASGIPTDLTEQVLRDELLPIGMVDNKVCAIDATWSGLRFVWRVRNRAHRRLSGS